MTSSSSAPSWPAPLHPSASELLGEVEQLNARAKSLGIVFVARRRLQIVAIDEMNDASRGSIQRLPPVQELTPNEQEFMEVFDSLGPVVTAQRLADEFGCSVKSLKGRELHALRVKGVIEGVQGYRGGYRRVRGIGHEIVGGGR